MGLITGLLGLPFAPIKGTIAVAEQIRRQAEEEYYDPAKIRRELEKVERLRDTGELTDDEATAIEDELVERLLVSQTRPQEREA